MLRLPVILFLSSAVFWLLVGSLLFCLAAWKLVVPSFLDGPGWLTYGRIQPAAENALAYGWASQAGIGLGLWLLARLGRTALGSERLLITAGLFWNLGVLLGVCSIIAGAGHAIRGLEFSGAASLILLVAYACIGVWGLILLRDRSSDGLYVSQWYLAGGLSLFSLALRHGKHAARLASGAGIRTRSDSELVFGQSSLALARAARLGCRLLSGPAHCTPPGACLPVERARFLVPYIPWRMDWHAALDWRSDSRMAGERECGCQHHDADSGDAYLHQHAGHTRRARRPANA